MKTKEVFWGLIALALVIWVIFFLKDEKNPRLWSTYTNSEIGYSLSYPVGWHIEDNYISVQESDLFFCPPSLIENGGCKVKHTLGNSVDTYAPILLFLERTGSERASSSSIRVLGNDSSGTYRIVLFLSNEEYVKVFNKMVESFKIRN